MTAESDRIQAVIDADCVPILIGLLGHTENSIIFSAHCSIGNIVTGTDLQVIIDFVTSFGLGLPAKLYLICSFYLASYKTEIILKEGVLVKLKRLLKNPMNNIVRKAAWTLSNITAGNTDQIQRIIDADAMFWCAAIRTRGRRPPGSSPT